MSIALSPNMSLPIPGVGNEPGPDFASDVNNSLTLIDGHNHTAGSGIPITPSAISINSALSMAGNTLTLTKSIQFQSQPSPLADLGSIYESGLDLYYTDGAGNQVRITQSGSLAGAAGTITGLPSGTASASFAAGTFVFQAATNTGANVDGASFIFRNSTANSFGLTLQPPNAMGANYALTLPTIPAQTNVMSLDASGNMGSITYDAVGQNMSATGANAIANSRTRGVSNLVGVGGVAISAPTTATNSTQTLSHIVAIDVQIDTSGRPVYLGLISYEGTDPDVGSAVQVVGSASGEVNFVGTSSAGTFTYATQVINDSGGGSGITVPPSSFNAIANVPAATYTFQVWIRVLGTPSTITIRGVRFVAYEL